MKWFKHLTDSYSNLKHREIIATCGMEGYGFFWLCCELIGQQGIKYRILSEKKWKKVLKSLSEINEQKIDDYLEKFAEARLICHKSLAKGDLYIPKMREYSDDYTNRVRRGYVPSPLRLDKNRLDKTIYDFIAIKSLSFASPQAKQSFWARHCKPAKELTIAIEGSGKTTEEVFKQAASYFGAMNDNKGLSWGIETILKHLPMILKYKPKPKVRYE